MNTIPLESPGVHLPHAPDGLSKWQRLQVLVKSPMTIRVICQQIAEGVSLKKIADGEMVPYGLLQEWIYTDKARLESYRNAQKMFADSLVSQAVERADEQYARDPAGEILRDKKGNPVLANVNWARLQVTTRLKVAQMLDSERFTQAAKVDTPSLSDDGIAQVAKHLAGAFERRHVPQDIEATE